MKRLCSQQHGAGHDASTETGMNSATGHDDGGGGCISTAALAIAAA